MTISADIAPGVEAFGYKRERDRSLDLSDMLDIFCTNMRFEN